MATRYHCERCGETFHEENIEYCVLCEKLVRPYCAAMRLTPATGKQRWICDVCAECRLKTDRPQGT